MSTRDQILEALTDNPAGLTPREITPHCTACECDEQIVARQIATLSAEHVIYPVGLRAGQNVYVFGKPPSAERVNEVPIESPAGKPEPHHMPLRFSKTAAVRAPDRAPKPETTPSPAQRQPIQEVPMATKKPVAERVVAALKERGASTLEQLAKHADTTVGTLYQMMGTLKKNHGVHKHAQPGRQAALYSLEQAAPPQKRAAPAQPAKAKKPAVKKPARINGRAPAARPVPPTNGDAQFAINEVGELGIEIEGQKIKLDAPAFERLRGFIERTQSVWQGGK